MFTRARLKLTAWYLLIIMIVSLSFSAVIYRVFSSEVDRLVESQRMRFERRIYLQFPNVWRYTEPEFDEELIRDIKRHMLINLAQINGAILFGAGLLGYYLAGRTLRPIQDMVDQQYRFVTDASHELKTPLTAMRTCLEVNLRDKQLTGSEAKRVLSDNLSEVIRLQHLSENLLDLNKTEGSVELVKQEIGPILESAIKEITPLADAKKIKIGISGKKDTVVMADSMSLKRAFVALLDNAVKYSDQNSSVDIRINKSGDDVKIAVIDQGAGINKKDLAHVTERFYRADRSRTTNGYGLGLSIVQEIVHTHKGTLSIKSKPGKGTKVTVHLPQANY